MLSDSACPSSSACLSDLYLLHLTHMQVYEGLKHWSKHLTCLSYPYAGLWELKALAYPSDLSFLPIFRFLGAMRQSKICIVGRSERDIENTTIPTHYTIRKYQEAMASGCLIAGDIPDNEVG